MPVKRPHLSRGESLRIALLQVLKQKTYPDPWLLPQPRLNLRPHLRKRIFPHLPLMGLLQLRRKPACLNVTSRCLPAYPGLGRRSPLVPVFAQLFHDDPHLLTGATGRGQSWPRSPLHETLSCIRPWSVGAFAPRRSGRPWIPVHSRKSRGYSAHIFCTGKAFFYQRINFRA
jgi:hypothetical protein